MTAFISSVRNGEAGPESSALFDDLDDVLEVMAAMGEELPDIEDPTSFRAAMKTEYRDKWKDACESELRGIAEMDVYKLVPRSEVPKGHKILKGKWVLTVKRDKAGKPTGFKARYVLCGYEHIVGRGL